MISPTAEQQAAVDSRAKRRVIIAHPGTGKTFTIVEILADYLGRRGRAGECVAAISFTRSAAAELRERAITRIGWHGTRDVLFGTSTALALAIVRECHRGLGLPAAVTIYDEQDQHDVMQDVIESLKLSGLSCSKALEALSAARALQPGEWPLKAMQAARAYEERLKRAGAVDLEQLLPLAVLALRQDQVARDRWRYRCRFLIVDEFQDTAPAEAALYEVLEPAELVIVGDPNQEIYAFRGTSNRFLLEAGRHLEAANYFLSQSFRSSAGVVQAANSLIAHNPDQPTERLKPARPGGQCVTAECFDDLEEAQLIVSTCRGALAAGESIAILCRTNRRLHSTRQALIDAGVPVFELALPRAFFALEEVRVYHAAFRGMVNPRDAIAVKLLCKVWPGLPRPGSDEWFDLQKEANATDGTVLGLARWEPLGWCDATFEELADALSHQLAARFEDEGRTTKAESIREARNRAMTWAARAAEPSVEAFVDWLQSREFEPAPRPETAEQAVNIGTIHSAKGLEWDRVIILGAEEGHMPHDRADLAEERRLAYVGLTRARVSCALVANREAGNLSRFCQETEAFIGDG